MRGVDEETKDLVHMLLRMIEAAYLEMAVYRSVLSERAPDSIQEIIALAREPGRQHRVHAQLAPAFAAKTVSEVKAAVLRAVELEGKPN